MAENPDLFPPSARYAGGQALRAIIARQYPGILNDSGWAGLPPATQAQWSSYAAEVAAAMLASVDPDLLSSEHVLYVTEDSWAIDHPLTCRPTRKRCPIQDAVTQNVLAVADLEPGTYPIPVAGCGCIVQVGQPCRFHPQGTDT